VQLGFHRVDADFFANFGVAPRAGGLGSTRDATPEGADALINMAALRRLGFARPVLAANLIAWPVAWLILANWLNGFAFRIDVPLSAFLAASGAALLVAWAAVAAHTIRMAGQSPIRALREL
jgi:hypothetical protein